MAFQHRYNYDDTFLREVMVGLISLLNRSVNIRYVLSDTEEKVKNLQFFLSLTGDSRFLQDHFQDQAICGPGDKVEGAYPELPYGTVTLDDVGIDAGGLTSQWTTGEFAVLDPATSTYETHSAYFTYLPLQLGLSLRIKVDTIIDSFKVTESLISQLYPYRAYHVQHQGLYCDCVLTMPTSLGREQQLEYGFEAEQVNDGIKALEVNVDLQLTAYYPLIDRTTERHASERLREPRVRLYATNPQPPSETPQGAPYGRDAQGYPLPAPEN